MPQRVMNVEFTVRDPEGVDVPKPIQLSYDITNDTFDIEVLDEFRLEGYIFSIPQNTLKRVRDVPPGTTKEEYLVVEKPDGEFVNAKISLSHERKANTFAISFLEEEKLEGYIFFILQGVLKAVRDQGTYIS